MQQITGLTPTLIHLHEPQPLVQWCDLSNIVFSDPFFNQTIARCLREDPSRLRFQTELEALADLYEMRPGLQPTGFIFHMSKCGSTLVSQTLAASPQNLVLSEPAPINSVLVTDLVGISEAATIKWLQLLINALGQKRRGTETNYFIKFKSWNIRKLALLKQAFPDVKWAFIYRNPVEVMVSVLKAPAEWMDLKSQSITDDPIWANLKRIPRISDGVTGFSAEEIEQMSAEEYCARVLASFCQIALQMADHNALMLNYNQLPEAIWSSLLDFFQVNYSVEDQYRMHAVSQLYSKDPAAHKRVFVTDSAAKQQQGSGIVQEMAAQWLAEVYDKLESQRMELAGYQNQQIAS